MERFKATTRQHTGTLLERILKWFKYFIVCALIASNAHGQTGNLALAEAYFEQSEWDKALSEYREIFKTNKSKGIYQKICSIYEIQGQLKRAERLAEDQIKTAGNQSDFYYVELGRLRLKLGDVKGANEAFNFLFQRIDIQPTYVYQSARLFEEARLFEQALTAYERAEQKSPQLNFYWQKAQIYGELGRLSDVFDAFIELVATSPSYLQNIKAYLSQSISLEADNPTNQLLKEKLVKHIQQKSNPQVVELLIWVFVEERQFSGAFQQLVSLDKQTAQYANAIFDFGYVCLRNGDYETVAECFNYLSQEKNKNLQFFLPARLALLDAQRLQAYESLPITLNQATALSNAYQITLKDLPFNTTTSSSFRHWALLKAFHLNDTIGALHILDSLLNIVDPRREEIDLSRLAYADVLTFIGRFYAAILAYAQVEKERTGTELADLAKFKRAQVAFYQGDFQWARNLFDALKQSTSKPIANNAMEYSVLIRDNIGLDTNTEALLLYAKAEMLQTRKKYSEALVVLNQMEIAFYEHSIQDELLWMKAKIFVDLSDFQNALMSLENLIENFGEGILADNALMLLAKLEEEQFGRLDKAQQHYATILEKHGDSFYLEEARNHYRRLRGDNKTP